jgi:hypothetical protein
VYNESERAQPAKRLSAFRWAFLNNHTGQYWYDMQISFWKTWYIIGRKGGTMITINNKKYMLLFFFLLLLIISCTCSGSTPVVNPPDQSGQQEQNQSTNPQKPLGSARSNPAPIGYEVTIDNMVIVVKGVISPADDTVIQANMFNPTSEPNMVYIFVDISITCKKTTDEKCSILGFEFSVIDSNGVSHDIAFVAGVSSEFEGGEFYGGATKTGYFIYNVPKDDNKLILEYSSIISEAYLALY